MKTVNKVEFDINNPVMPPWVTYCDISTFIVDKCKQANVEIPECFEEFVKEYPYEEGYEWGIKLFKHLETASLELLNRWLEVLHPGFVRAELRAFIKRKQSELPHPE